ncbi:MAG: hypothetical protein JST83_12110 [Bacteroidetes bacterium]|nr:hypothetical protein [Bacteroidota bacterium]
MKIVVWTGNAPNQRALACKIHQQYPLAGIVIESHQGTKRKITADKVIERLFLSRITDAWRYLMDFYTGRYPAWPDVPTLQVENINTDEAFDFTQKLQPDLIIVSGTRLIRKKLLSLQPSIGILNLHTGLSPYVKGGPNCTNWCLARREPHLIGSTIMWIDAGVDTGNIITTEITDLTGSESLKEVHIKVMEHAHDLYIRAIGALAAGKRSSVSQKTITEGQTYRNKDWTLAAKWALVRNFRFFKSDVSSPDYQKKRADIVTVKL